jgi:ribonuclease HII
VPDLQFEEKASKETGTSLIAGLDEAGRGALAGPVVAAAVVLPLDSPRQLALLCEVNDSKQLSAVKREQLYSLITANALTFGVGITPAALIDEIGIIPATKLAMLSALDQLKPPAHFLLIDGRIRLKNIPLAQQSIIRGDVKSLSIAAASILAKVSRDRIMMQMESRYPGYGFARHKGYGTEFHRLAITRLGPSGEHRMTFSPLCKKLL